MPQDTLATASPQYSELGHFIVGQKPMTGCNGFSAYHSIHLHLVAVENGGQVQILTLEVLILGRGGQYMAGMVRAAVADMCMGFRSLALHGKVCKSWTSHRAINWNAVHHCHCERQTANHIHAAIMMSSSLTTTDNVNCRTSSSIAQQCWHCLLHCAPIILV